jgi:uncharacterized membrane-anchored protein
MHQHRKIEDTQRVSKVPEVTLGFWIITIFATTLGETGGDRLHLELLKAQCLKTFTNPTWSPFTKTA